MEVIINLKLMKIFLTFIIWLFCVPLISPNNDGCKSFKTGKFMYYSAEKNTFDSTHISIRTESTQTYIDLVEGDTLVYSLNWLSDCNYELTLKESNVENTGFLAVGEKLEVRIEPLDELTIKYTSIVEKEGLKRELEGKMKLIKE